MRNKIIFTMEDMIELIEYYGFLPFFENEISGFSVAEHCDPSIYFTDKEGPWEWKGPIISELGLAYGKFFHRKAGFITKKWFVDFANYRRNGYDFEAACSDGLMSEQEQYLYSLLETRHSALSKELKAIGGYNKPKEKGKDAWQPRKGFDTTLTKLQMKGYILTSNFEYEIDKEGKPYGWGITRYALAETYLGKSFSKHIYDRKVEESYKRMVKHLKKVLPEASDAQIEHLLMNK
ncbi:MAG: hypothetical protein IJ875_00110 [Solobacterium sp.]|nr:hypothetical protein [Solobacterium sp.]